MLLIPCPTPVHNGVFPLAFSMMDLSTIVLMGVTAKPVHRPAMIYCGPKSQNERFCLIGKVILFVNYILNNNVINNNKVEHS